MSKKKLVNYCVFILGLFLFCFGVSAEQVTVNGHYIQATGSGMVPYISPAGGSFNDARQFSSFGGLYVSGKTTNLLSVKNGKYTVWFPQTNGTKISKNVTVTSSCSNTPTQLDKKGKFTIERCLLKTSSGIKADESAPKPYTCAAGYSAGKDDITVAETTCRESLNGFGARWCRTKYVINCKQTSQPPKPKPNVPAAKLASLSVNPGHINFKSNTYTYRVNVDGNTSSISVNASAASGGRMVTNYGSRNVKLNYGDNKVQVKVKNSSNKITTYTIVVNRADNRSDVNTLSNLIVGSGTLTPAFNASITNYKLNVLNNVTNLKVDATLTDNKSRFVEGFGPGVINLNPGLNKVYIKVASEKGTVNVYSIDVVRDDEPTECAIESDKKALAKQIILSVDKKGIEVPQIKDFDPTMFTYNDIKIPYEVTNLKIDVVTNDDADKEHVVIKGNEELVVGDSRAIEIIITSHQCPSVSKTYTLNVVRQPEVVPSDNAQLADIKIKGYDDFKFEPNVTDYKIILHKKDKKLDIEVVPEDENAEFEIEGNKDLKYGSVITINCLAENKEKKLSYTITVDGVEKGMNVFLVVIVVIVVLLILVYIVLRLFGYKIYFNTAVIGAFFRGIGEKIRNLFDK